MTSTNAAAQKFKIEKKIESAGEPPCATLARAMVDEKGRYLKPINFSAIAAASTQAVPVDASTIVNLTEQWDSHKTFASNRFTPGQLGIYQLTGYIGWSVLPSGGGSIGAAINKNGTQERLLQLLAGPEDLALAIGGTCIVRVTALTDYFELTAYQDNGGPFNLVALGTCFQGVYLGPLT